MAPINKRKLDSSISSESPLPKKAIKTEDSETYSLATRGASLATRQVKKEESKYDAPSLDGLFDIFHDVRSGDITANSGQTSSSPSDSEVRGGSAHQKWARPEEKRNDVEKTSAALQQLESDYERSLANLNALKEALRTINEVRESLREQNKHLQEIVAENKRLQTEIVNLRVENQSFAADKAIISGQCAFAQKNLAAIRQILINAQEMNRFLAAQSEEMRREMFTMTDRLLTHLLPLKKPFTG